MFMNVHGNLFCRNWILKCILIDSIISHMLFYIAFLLDCKLELSVVLYEEAV